MVYVAHWLIVFIVFCHTDSQTKTSNHLSSVLPVTSGEVVLDLCCSL